MLNSFFPPNISKMADSGSASGRHSRHSRQHHQQHSTSQQQQQHQQQQQQQAYYEDASHLGRVTSGKTSHISGGQPSYDGRGEKRQSRHHADNRSVGKAFHASGRRFESRTFQSLSLCSSLKRKLNCQNSYVASVKFLKHKYKLRQPFTVIHYL